MRTHFLQLTVLLVSCFSIGRAQDSDIHYVHFTDGRVWGYPKDFVKELKKQDSQYVLTLENDSVISWPATAVKSVSEKAPDYPQFTAFKLDDKLNDQLFRDVEATVTAYEVTATVSGIGKYLTSSFAMDKEGAVAYVNGVEQVSGESRLRFANEVVYTLSHPDYKYLSVEKISDEVWDQPESSIQEIPLTEAMLSTNAPTSFVNEGLGMMLDGNPSTIFHSTWSQDLVYEVDLSKQVYVSVDLPKSLSEFQFYYQGRADADKYNIYKLKIEASHDGIEWDYITTMGQEEGLPIYGASVSYTSPTITLGDSYDYLRFTAVEVGYKNYLCLSEFRLYEVYGVGGEPELIQPAEYAYRMVPMGREVPVHIDWLTDYATSVPRIDIDIDGGEMVSSKEYYLNAQITFQGNGVWDEYDFQDSVQIKGRGNTSWSSYAYAKNPYRLKFDESVKPFGMKKGKNWNLIPQAQRGSLMTNPVAHKIARMVGLETANDAIPVELYMNGEYRGSYYFTQKVGMANNSVDFEDESQAVLFELDSYSEAGQFYSDSYYLPVNIKSPEFGEDETLLDYYGIQSEFNRFEAAVYNNSNYERFVNMNMLVRYMLVNDLVLNTELNHPKSSFLSRENMNHMTSQYTFGPGWDFDWAYGYEGTSSYCVSGATRDLFSYIKGSAGNLFFSDLLRSSDWVQYRYYRLWEEFVDKHLDELIDFVDDYYAYARSSFKHNYDIWYDGYDYDYKVSDMKSWLKERALYIKNSLTPYETEQFTYGDLNGDGTINDSDVEYMLSSLFDTPKHDLLDSQADADANGEVSLSDLTWLNLLLGNEQEMWARSRQREAELWSEDDDENEDACDFDIDDMPALEPQQNGVAKRASVDEVSEADALSVGIDLSEGKWRVTVSLANATPYIAYSMDIVLTEAFTLPEGEDIFTLSYRTEDSFVMTGCRINANTYRIIGYSTSNTAIVDTEGALFTLSLDGTQALTPGTYNLNVENIHCVTENAEETSLANVGTSFEVTEKQLTQITSWTMQSPCWPADVYDIHGRLVRKQATSLQGLSRGVYIVNNCKVVL